jgi:hypothetical protein
VAHSRRAPHGVFTETFDADVMCRFLDRLASHFARKVHLVVDGHSAHRSRTVRMAGRSPGPSRAALPAVALTGAEPRRTGQRRPQTEPSDAQPCPDQAQLAAEILRFFHRRQRQPHIVRGSFRGPHVCYNLE